MECGRIGGTEGRHGTAERGSARLWGMLGLDGNMARRIRTAGVVSFRAVNNNKERNKGTTDERISCLFGFALGLTSGKHI
jgi:hypothetical protein